MPIKVFIENLKPNMSPYNGKGKFIQRLADEFSWRRDIDLVVDPYECDINFRMNALPSTKYGKKVMRLDNVAYSNETLHKRVNANYMVAESIVKADGVVFQSTMSMNNCTGCLNVMPKKSVVISNGVDPKLFRAQTTPLIAEHNYLIAHQIMHPMRRLAQVLCDWETKTKNEHLYIAFDKDLCGYTSCPQNCSYIDAMKGQLLKDMVRSMDAVLFTTYMDSCPNFAIECLAIGTPVVLPTSCGLIEFVEGCSGVSIYQDAEPVLSLTAWDKPPAYNSESFFDAMSTLCYDFDFPEKLNIKNVAGEYVKFFDGLL